MPKNIMPLFKVQEPFMPAPDRGIGYAGVMLRDIDDDTLQCHVCGKWIRCVGNHARIAHGISAKDYKIKYGLPLGLGMVSTATSAAHSRRAVEQNESVDESPLIKAGEILAERRASAKKSGKPIMALHGRKSQAHKNKYGLCDAQIMGRYHVVKAIIGDHPTIPQLINNDRTLYDGIRRRYGSLHGFRRKYGYRLERVNRGSRYEDVELIAMLRSWAKKHKKGPSIRAFNLSRHLDQPHASTILEHFGSWNAAMHAAGLR